MHPLRERICDELLENPLLRTPPPEPEKPRPPRVRKPREFKLPAKFTLLPKDFYSCWCNHQKELQMAKHKVDDSPPELFPELYLKPRRLDYYARQLEQTMNVNKELLKRINLIQRTGGFVDCWMHEPCNKYNKLLCEQRQRNLNEIQKNNFYFYSRLLVARSEQLLTKELDEAWKDTKHKLILGASLPFILFKTGKIDRGMKDPAFDKPPSVYRPRVSLDIWVLGGSKIGKVMIELFNDIVPKTCQLFLNLVKGDSMGHAYTGTRIFRIVPDLYCCGGDVTKNNGFGCYTPEGDLLDTRDTDCFKLKHTVPGVVSMVVSPNGEVCGQFNIIFKPLPQFDNKHVVFGRIIAGPAPTLERISALGLPLGTTSTDCIVKSCGWFTRKGEYREGNPNTIKFPPRRKAKK
ncbi:uncharacterized protein LOC113508542 [Trichoplusia ni]|uniref:Uncharacterized protein LOC113508542 n=1 Tax=Trichoplusia ni TaxID=7111 RepID=A0A7E5X486_TRINI|nr:uncharacterized protein LOC113508542 [Trichoplusia ni]